MWRSGKHAMITSGGTVQAYSNKTSSSLMTLVWDSHCLLCLSTHSSCPCPRLTGGFPAIMITNKHRYLVMHLSSAITFRIAGSFTNLSNIAYLKFTPTWTSSFRASLLNKCCAIGSVMRARRWGEVALFLHIHVLLDKCVTKSLDSLLYPRISNAHAARETPYTSMLSLCFVLELVSSWSPGPADLAYFDHINGECLVMPSP